MNKKGIMRKLEAYFIVVALLIGTLWMTPVNKVKATELATDTDASATDDHAGEESKGPSIYYTTHVQTYGWQEDVSNGEMSGTSGESKRLEGIKIRVESDIEGGIEYSVHCQTYGWMKYESDYEMAGTSGESKRLESIRIRLTGQLGEEYDVLYRVHRQTYGWTDWVKNGADCGTTGESKRLEGIQIKLVKKGEAPYATLKYTTHVQTYGWLPYVSSGQSSGTSGESKRMEALKIDIDSNLTGGVHYQVHCQNYGWMGVKGNSDLAGTEGESKRLEAIRIYLTGELAEHYDIYYRTHIQSLGWLGWAYGGNGGALSGTEACSRRMEAVQIILVEKGTPRLDNEAIRSFVTLEDVLWSHPEATSGIQKEIIDYALQYLDVPYVYGGKSLEDGTDCSGFTMLVYAKFGVNLPHNADWQAYCGRPVSFFELKAGDLLFRDNDGDGSMDHVMIYIGRNKVVHQPQPGGKCCIDDAKIYWNGIGMNPAAAKAVRLIEY